MPFSFCEYCKTANLVPNLSETELCRCGRIPGFCFDENDIPFAGAPAGLSRDNSQHATRLAMTTTRPQMLTTSGERGTPSYDGQGRRSGHANSLSLATSLQPIIASHPHTRTNLPASNFSQTTNPHNNQHDRRNDRSSRNWRGGPATGHPIRELEYDDTENINAHRHPGTPVGFNQRHGMGGALLVYDGESNKDTPTVAQGKRRNAIQDSVNQPDRKRVRTESVSRDADIVVDESPMIQPRNDATTTRQPSIAEKIPDTWCFVHHVDGHRHDEKCVPPAHVHNFWNRPINITWFAHGPENILEYLDPNMPTTVCFFSQLYCLTWTVRGYIPFIQNRDYIFLNIEKLMKTQWPSGGSQIFETWLMFVAKTNRKSHVYLRKVATKCHECIKSVAQEVWKHLKAIGLGGDQRFSHGAGDTASLLGALYWLGGTSHPMPRLNKRIETFTKWLRNTSQEFSSDIQVLHEQIRTYLEDNKEIGTQHNHEWLVRYFNVITEVQPTISTDVHADGLQFVRWPRLTAFGHYAIQSSILVDNMSDACGYQVDDAAIGPASPAASDEYPQGVPTEFAVAIKEDSDSVSVDAKRRGFQHK